MDEVPEGENGAEDQPPPESESLKEASKKSESASSAPAGPTVDLSSVISETVRIIKSYRDFLSDRKTKQAMALYYLHKLSSALTEYTNFEKKLDNFFCQHEALTSEIYLCHCTKLPCYGDYTKILKDNQNTIRVAKIPGPVPEAEIRTIVLALVDNVFAGGNYTRTMLKICQNIISCMEERRSVVQDVGNDFPFWFDLLNKQVANNGILSDNMFETLSFINFLNSGMEEEPLQLSLSNYGNSPVSEPSQ